MLEPIPRKPTPVFSSMGAGPVNQSTVARRQQAGQAAVAAEKARLASQSPLPGNKPSKPPPGGLAYEFNPPIPDWQRGGTRDGVDSTSRRSVIGVANVPVSAITGGNRAYMVQDDTFTNDWVTLSDVQDDKRRIASGTSLLGGVRYGFQFHYNPAQLDFQAGLSNDVDLAMITSGSDKSLPWSTSDSPGLIAISLVLNRTEDMNVIDKNGYIREDVLSAYDGSPYPDSVGPSMLKEIYERGTGLDLEYFFRCVIGRPYPTELRQSTADVGIMYGVPQRLVLNERMKYRGRVTSLSYQHRLFVRDLVPTYTTMSISFERFPDVTSAGVTTGRSTDTSSSEDARRIQARGSR